MISTTRTLGASEFQTVRNSKNSRLVFLLLVQVHPDYAERVEDPMLFERYMRTDRYYVLDDALYIYDEESGSKQVYAAGVWGTVRCSEVFVGASDGGPVSDDELTELLGEMNQDLKVATEERLTRGRVWGELFPE